MTTHVTITVPSPNHRRVRVSLQDATRPETASEGDPVVSWIEQSHAVLDHGDSVSHYLHTTRRIVLTEID